MGLRESLSNIPVVVSYGSNEAEAAATLFDGRFTKTRGDTGWIIAAELITDHLTAHQACCLPDGRCESCPPLFQFEDERHQDSQQAHLGSTARVGHFSVSFHLPPFLSFERQQKSYSPLVLRDGMLRGLGEASIH